ncbi:BspA family leucine-rich repeat surface protein [uncultured Winogradskyella sp.]|uniref:BspA family leucine-rich repeat surface protein n=1 Tax=uncultured Winogradskyella sp. TaxID=395353 RepID=UPI002617FDD9|nr:BspA family leucine-rich repeat surface protein [uncultured Winogradskyella sp.]
MIKNTLLVMALAITTQVVLGQNEFVTTWKTDNPGTSNSTSITIPTNIAYTYNYNVDWDNDGVVDEFGITGDITHDFGAPGTYTIRLNGDFPHFSMPFFGDNKKLLSVDQWGNIEWLSMFGAFNGCSNMHILATDAPDLSNVEFMTSMFNGCSSMNENINHWDVSNVTDMHRAFINATNYNQPLDNWDMSNVQDMGQMFINATSYDQDLSNWDFSSCISLGGFLSGAELSVENYDALLIGWSTDGSGVADDGIDDVPTNLDQFSGGNSTYCLGSAARQDLIDTYGWTNFTDGGLTCASSDFFITTWKTDNPGGSNNTSITIQALSAETYDFEVDWTYDGVSFNAEDINVTGNITHDYSVAGTYTVAIRGTFPRVFWQSTNDKQKLMSIEQWGNLSWSSMNSSFSDCINLNINATDAPDLSNVEDMAFMFSSCTLLNADINHWDIGNVTNLNLMFADATAFNQPLSNWDVSKVLTMSNMFSGATRFDQDLGNWDLSSVLSISGLLFGCELSLENYDSTLVGWATDASGVAGDGIDDIPQNMFFHGGTSVYCDANTPRQELIDTHNWTITDAGEACFSEDYFVITFKTDNPGGSNDSSITIPTFLGETYDYDVDWTYEGADFNPDDTNVTGNITHDYGVAGTYTVAIRGNFPRIYFESSNDAQKLLAVEQWGTQEWTSMGGAFTGCSNFNIINPTIDTPDLSNVKDMFRMFKDCSSFNAPIGNWDVSNVDNMQEVFALATIFNQDIGDWDVSNVLSMAGMFSDTGAFNQDISNWNVSSVNTMKGMFARTMIFNQDIDNWDVSNVEDLSNMFTGAIAFNQSLSSWDVTSVENMTAMFSNATAFNQDISNWDVSGVNRMNTVFNGATSFDQNLGNWDISSLTEIAFMFDGAELSRDNYDNTLIGWSTDSSGVPGDGVDDVPTNLDLFSGGNSVYCTGENARQELIDTYGWTNFIDGGYDCVNAHFVTTWKTNNPGVSNSSSITIPTFSGETYAYDVDWTYDGVTFNAEDINVTGDITHDYGVAGTYTVAIRGTFPRIYFRDSDDPEKLLTVEQWGTQEWTSMAWAFAGCRNFNITNPTIDTPDLSNVTSMTRMFIDCSSFNGAIGNWDVSNATSMSLMFYRAEAFNQDIDSWDVSSVRDMGNMFREAVAFNQDIGSWDVSRVTSMESMFSQAIAFNQDIGNWDVSSVRGMSDLFRDATAFNQDISNWDVSSVTRMNAVFDGATSFDQNLGNWDLSSVTEMAIVFLGVKLSRENYDNTLIGWSTDTSGVPGDGIDDVPTNIDLFNGGSSTYCDGASARQTLIDTYGWTNFSDGGVDCPTDYFLMTWKTDNPGASNDHSITIPTFLGETYNYDVDWTYDGVTFNAESTNVTGDITYQYDVEGTYTVAIRGVFPRIRFRFSDDPKKLLTVEQWGANPWTSMNEAFFGCSNFNITNPTIDTPNLSNVTEMIAMFQYCSSFNGAIGNWDVSNVEKMTALFRNAPAFNQDISNWDVSSVISMDGVFDFATSFDQNLSDWDLSSVTQMAVMFEGVKLSRENYDNTLIGWATDTSGVPGDGIDDVPTNIDLFNGGSSTYCDGASARQTLIDTYGWTNFNDGGVDCPTDYFVMTWKTDNPGASNDRSITIPTFSGETYTYQVDWTYDGVAFNAEDVNVTGDITHDYGLAGTYTVAIRGTFPRIYFESSSDPEKLLTVEQWGTSPWTSMAGAFTGCTNFNIVNPSIDTPDLSNVFDMTGMFSLCSSFNAPIGNWDVSSVEDMTALFDRATLFNQDISNWDVSNVMTTGGMFRDAIAFNQDIGSWDISSALNTNSMFVGATAFNQDLSSWDMTSVENMTAMFRNATAFNQDISTWDVSGVNRMNAVFEGATGFDQNLGDWDISSVTEMAIMFSGAELSEENYDALLIGWSTDSSGVPGDGIDDVPTNLDLFSGGSSTYCNGANARQELIDTYGWTNFTDGGLGCASQHFIMTWKTDNPGASSDTQITIPTTGGGYNYEVDWTYDGVFFNAEDVNVTGDITHDYGLAGTYTVAIRGTFPRIYFESSSDPEKLLTVEQWGISPWTSMAGAFTGCTNFNIVNPSIDTPDLSNVLDMTRMFNLCSSFNAPIGNWDVSSVESMFALFNNATLFNQDISNWDVSNVKRTGGMFRDAIAFNQDIGSWDISSALNTNSMFLGATAFNQDLSSWDMTSVENMTAMFRNATAFNQDISTWDVSGVNRMNAVFEGATSFDQNLGDWDISSVTEMAIMFSGAELSEENYDALLIGWSTDSSGVPGDGIDDVPTNLDLFSGGNSMYCLGSVARQDLIDTYGWTNFTDGGMSCDSSDYFVMTWKTDNPGASNNTSITIPTSSGETYNYQVDWTYDGVIFNPENVIFSGSITHDYGVAGTYTVAIRGNFPQIDFGNNPGDKDKILTIEQWGTNPWTSMLTAFMNCSNLNINASDAPNLSNANNLLATFLGCTSLNADINHWDVSNITNMWFTFKDATSFDQPLDNWDVSNVTVMESMFSGATSFNQSLNNWDVSSAEYMNVMFQGATSFNQPLNNWDVSSVVNMNKMFDGATSFDQDLGSWDLSSVTVIINMFVDAQLSQDNYDALLIGWSTDSSGVPGDGIDDIPTNLISFSGGNSTYCLAESARQELIDTYGWTNFTDGGLDCPSTIVFSPKVYLQGASINPNTGEETLMRDDLRLNNLIPFTSPYSDGLVADASVFAISGVDAIVDWVWVELRDKDDSSIVMDSQSALLQRDGDVVGIDGVSPLSFNQSADSYYVSINHRNHVGIISASMVALSTIITIVDLASNLSNVEGGVNAVVALANGKYGMYTGDYNPDGQIQNTDANAAIQQIGSSDYNLADMDVNSQVQNTDINLILIPNIGVGQQFSRPELALFSNQFAPDMTLSFANAQITNDGVDDYYEADIMIESTEDFYVGSGQIYIEYNTAAFGENISGTGALDYGRPDGSILGQTFFGGFVSGYSDFVEQDNTSSRVSLSFQQNATLSVLQTEPVIQITDTPNMLLHIKIKYSDVSQDANVCFFYDDGLFQDQFITACGGSSSVDCIGEPGEQITNDTYDCSDAGVDTLSTIAYEEDAIVLYPNPASRSFKLKGLKALSMLKVYDINGRLIMKQNYLEDQAIDMSRYEDGIYIIEISTGHSTIIKRLIKKER